MSYPALILITLFATGLLSMFGFRRAMAGFRQASVDADAAADAAGRLPAPLRRVIECYLGVSDDPDEALSQALSLSASIRPPAWRTPALLISLFLALLPACAALLQTASVIQRLATTPPEITRFGHARIAIEASFSAAQQALHQSSWLAAGLSIGALFLWWMDRAEARQGELLRTLLELHTRLHPGAPAPKSVFLALRLRPSPDLRRAVLATLLWFGATSVGAALLIAAAPVRLENFRPLSLDVWPTEDLRPIETGAEVQLPRPTGGGHPVDHLSYPSLSVSPQEVRLQQTPLAHLKDGQLPAGWTQSVPPLKEQFKAYPQPLKLILLADASIPVHTLTALMGWLTREYKVSEFFLVAQRHQTTSGGERRIMQVYFPARLLRGSRRATPLRLSAKWVRIAKQRLGWAEDWGPRLQAEVRGTPALLRADKPERLGVQLRGSDLTYGQLIEALGAADAPCDLGFDCGLPGLGLRFDLQTRRRAPRPSPGSARPRPL